MKRPQGFDPPGREAEAPSAKRTAARRQTVNPKSANPKPNPKSAKPKSANPKSAKSKLAVPTTAVPKTAQKDKRVPDRQTVLARLTVTPRKRAETIEADGARANSSSQARQAARRRRRYERDEVRRFTRRARSRRWAWISAVSVIAALIGTVTIAVYSPLLALTTIEVTGTSSVNPDDVVKALDDQLGTPLALVDSDRLTRELAEFTLIQSYVTETVPPGTLIVHITERKPIGSIATASGFTVVDPAGVVIEKTDVRPAGVPTIELAGADTDSSVFNSVVEVLLTLPQSVLSQVDRVTAATKDDVTLVLAGAGQRVVWGSAEQSELKARVLASLMATQDPAAPVEYDVTAPLNAVIRGA